VVVDYGFVSQSQCSYEAVGAGRFMDNKADEGDTLWVYKYSGAGDRSCPQVTGTDIGKSSIRQAADRSTSANCPPGGISRLRQRCADKTDSEKDSLRDR
jgi:hypothetical protein